MYGCRELSVGGVKLHAIHNINAEVSTLWAFEYESLKRDRNSAIRSQPSMSS